MKEQSFFEFNMKDFEEDVTAIHSILWDLKRDIEKDFCPFYNSKETFEEYKKQKDKILALDILIKYLRHKYGKIIFK